MLAGVGLTHVRSGTNETASLFRFAPRIYRRHVGLPFVDPRLPPQTGGMNHIAMPAPASIPNTKTINPMAVFADWLGHSRSGGGCRDGRAQTYQTELAHCV